MAEDGPGSGPEGQDRDNGVEHRGPDDHSDGHGPDDHSDGHGGDDRVNGHGGDDRGDGYSRDAGTGDAARTGGSDSLHGAYAEDTPEQLLGEAAAVRRRTRRARHAYWFPLVLFGLLTCASIPLYIRSFPTATGVYVVAPVLPSFLRWTYLGGFGFLTNRFIVYYWLAAIVLGVAATAGWYRWRGNRVGLRTPTRGYVISGGVLLVLALGIPALAMNAIPQLRFLMPGDLLLRGTFPLVLIGVGLCYLAWAERSVALAVIAASFLALSLIASLYDIENVVYRFGWNLDPAVSGLPNVVLPALVLLLSGAGAWAVQRRAPRLSGPPRGEAASEPQ
jgi:hypothetical protein